MRSIHNFGLSSNQNNKCNQNFKYFLSSLSGHLFTYSFYIRFSLFFVENCGQKYPVPQRIVWIRRAAVTVRACAGAACVVRDGAAPRAPSATRACSAVCPRAHSEEFTTSTPGDVSATLYTLAMIALKVELYLVFQSIMDKNLI